MRARFLRPPEAAATERSPTLPDRGGLTPEIERAKARSTILAPGCGPSAAPGEREYAPILRPRRRPIKSERPRGRGAGGAAATRGRGPRPTFRFRAAGAPTPRRMFSACDALPAWRC